MTEITQADRDAAAECIRQGVSHPPLTDIISGKKDHWFFVQAFARHRIEATAALSAEIERLREAMEQVSVEIYDVAEFMNQAGADAQTLEAKNEWLRKALGEVLVYAPDFMHGMPKKNYEKLANGEL